MALNITISGNYESCCRTCLSDKDEDVMIDIFEIQDSLNIIKMLLTCTSICIKEGDTLPKRMCNQCYKCLTSFYEFKKSAEIIDTQLRHISKSHTKQECNLSIEYESKTIKEEERVEAEEEFKLDLKKAVEININNKIANTDLKVQHKCEFCSKTFRNKSKLDQHKTLHTRVSNPDAKIVTNEMNIGCSASELRMINGTNQNFVCDVCSDTFKSLNSLSAHKRKHIAKNRVLACLICGKIFKKVSHLKRHELTHTANRPYKCSICTKTFAMESTYLEHINKHNGIQNHVCLLCNKSFAHLRTLKAHIGIHSNNRPYLCPTCGKRFQSSTNLNQHVKRHIGLKLFACSLCPKQFVSQGELKSHSLTHTGKAVCACDQCGSTFTKRSSLKKHELGHLGIKPHHCNICPMKFISKDHLKCHYRIHTGEKPYRCDICSKAYSQSNDLVKHKRMHLGDKLYKCSECTSNFRLKTELRHHMSRHFVSSQLNTKGVQNTSMLNDLNKISLESELKNS